MFIVKVNSFYIYQVFFYVNQCDVGNVLALLLGTDVGNEESNLGGHAAILRDRVF